MCVNDYPESAQRSAMFRTLISAAALVLAASSALASDLPSTKSAPIFEPASAYNWSGFYVGAIAGVNLINYQGYGFNTTPVLGHVGGVIGYNHQYANKWVIGLEADGGGIFGGATTTKIAAPFTSVNNKSSYFTDFRARLGYAVGERTLLYVLGGVGFRDQSEAYSNGAKFNAGVVAPSVGAGVDYAVTSNWILRAEYSFSDGVPKTYTFGPGWTDKVAMDDHRISLGLLYKFGAPSAVVAKY
jgi:outer membrane immunogenic protein